MVKNSFSDNIAKISTRLTTKGFFKDILVFDTIPSTNSTAKTLAQKGAPEGTVVVAQKQQKGRGRFDRTWESPIGGLYLSIILRPHQPPKSLSLLPLISALAVAKTIQSFDLLPTIKWPNDVRIDQKKVAGILLETETAQSQTVYVIVGIGINVNINPAQLSTDLQKTSTSLSQENHESIDLYKFFETLLITFQSEYGRFLAGGYKSLMTEWKSFSDTLGKQVKIKTPTGDIIGTAVDITSSGFLIITTDAGLQKTITSGDCLYLSEL